MNNKSKPNNSRGIVIRDKDNTWWSNTYREPGTKATCSTTSGKDTGSSSTLKAAITKASG